MVESMLGPPVCVLLEVFSFFLSRHGGIVVMVLDRWDERRRFGLGFSGQRSHFVLGKMLEAYALCDVGARWQNPRWLKLARALHVVPRSLARIGTSNSVNSNQYFIFKKYCTRGGACHHSGHPSLRSNVKYIVCSGIIKYFSVVWLDSPESISVEPLKLIWVTVL